MNISPLDIRKHEFKKSLRGYDVDEVTAFLDIVSLEYETLIRDNALLNEKVKTSNEQLKKYHDIESTLQETLLSAERAREETVKTAKKQAEMIIREAEVKAAARIEDGRKVFTRLQNKINELMIQKDTYLSKIKALIKSQLETFDNVSFPEEERFKDIGSVFEDEKTTEGKTDVPAAGNEKSEILLNGNNNVAEDNAITE